MKSEMILRRDGGTLRPDGDASWEVMDRIPHGASVVVVVRKSRNVEHLAKYWSLCAFVADFDPEFDDRRDVDNWVRMSIPWMRESITLRDADVIVRLKSISIDEMDQTAFDKFYERAVELLSARIGKDVEQAMAEARPRPSVGSFDR